MSNPKEPSFFSRNDLLLHTNAFLDGQYIWETLNWETHRDTLLRRYSKLFEHAPAGALCGEATSEYLLSRRAASRIRELIPNAKLIVMLREPVRRAISNYWYDVQLGQVCLKPGAYFYTNHAAHRLRWGLYREHLEHWLSYFPQDQFHFVLFEEYISPRTRQGVVDGVCRFLGVEPALDVARLKAFSNKTGVPRSVTLELALNLVRLRFELPGTTAYADRWPKNRFRRIIHRIVRKISAFNLSYNKPHPAWPPLLCERLRAFYRDENAGLSELIGRDLDAVWYGGEPKAAVPDRAVGATR
jgi:hypothetical protein